jgi:hypothetical protein
LGRSSLGRPRKTGGVGSLVTLPGTSRPEVLCTQPGTKICGSSTIATLWAMAWLGQSERINQLARIRAKSAPLRARSERFSGGFERFHTGRLAHQPTGLIPLNRAANDSAEPKTTGWSPRLDMGSGRFSRPVHSTALPPFHGHDEGYRSVRGRTRGLRSGCGVLGAHTSPARILAWSCWSVTRRVDCG